MDINSNQPIIEFPFPNSEFLSTAFIAKMNGPHGTIPYLEMVVESKEDDEMGQIGLQVRNKQIAAETFQVTSESSKTQSEELQKMGIDMDSQMSSILNNESFLGMEKQLHDKYYNLGIRTYRKSYGKWKSFLNQYFNLEFPIYTEVNKIGSKILILSQMTAIRTRRGSANFVIVSPMVASMLMEDPSVRILETEMRNNSTEIYPSLSIADKIKVFIDPKMKYDNMTIVLGKTTESGNTGVVMGQYSRNFMKVDSVGATDFQPTTKYQIRDRYVITDTNESASDGFFTVNLVIGKKPLWRKLIGA